VSDHLKKFTEGWMTDDLDMLLSGCADDFVYDDPVDGRITKAQFADYYRGLPDGESEHDAEMVQEAEGGETHWIWWAWKPAGETEWAQEGSALTKADADGVHSMRIAYYKR